MRSRDLLVELRLDLRGFDLQLFLPDQLGELALSRAELLDLLVCDVEGVEDLRLGDLISAGLDHQDRLVGAGDDQVQLALGNVWFTGIDHEIPLELADAHGAHLGRERNVGYGESRRGAVHGEHVVGIDVIDAHRRCDDLGLASPPLREKGTDRPVDHARGEDSLLGRAPFAPEKAAGDLAGGVHTLLDVDSEGEEVDIAGISRRRGAKNERFARTHDHGAVRLLGELAGLEADLGPLDLGRDPRHSIRSHRFLSGSLRLAASLIVFRNQSRES